MLTGSFALNYYAVNATWNCSVRVNDSTGLYGSGSSLAN